MLQGVAVVGFDYHWLLEECTVVLQAQAKAGKPDHGYMAGAVAGMSSALAHCKVATATFTTLARTTLKTYMSTTVT